MFFVYQLAPLSTKQLMFFIQSLELKCSFISVSEMTLIEI